VLRIVNETGQPLSAVAGDALSLKVVLVAADGTATDLAAGATTTWTQPAKLTALPPNTNAPSLVNPSVVGEAAIATWVGNPTRTDRMGDAGLLFILDSGTVQNAVVHVAADVTNAPNAGHVEVDIPVAPAPLGDFRRGKDLFTTNCSVCHGDTGGGSDASVGSFMVDGMTYDFPAPGLNAVPGNVASDPEWTPALLAFAARSDVDNHGVALRVPMPDWNTKRPKKTGVLLTTQDFVDVYAFLKTQTR
jgi:mono/diheme cytochrome c family protein